MNELNERQQQFIEEYLIDFNGTQAAIRAGYAENGASVTAHHLLRNPKIREIVEERKAERRQFMQDRFVDAADKALKVMLDLMMDEEVSPQTRYNAAKDLMDRAGHKPTDKQEITGKDGGSIEITNPQQLLADRIAKLSGRTIEVKAD